MGYQLYSIVEAWERVVQCLLSTSFSCSVLLRPRHQCQGCHMA